MYDVVLVNCPNCGKEHEFQSKGGNCSLEVYTLEKCPDDVLQDVNRHSPYVCECGEVFQVDIPRRAAVERYSVPAVRVRHYNEETGVTENGTVIAYSLNTYLVVPDYDVERSVRWDRKDCNVLR